MLHKAAGLRLWHVCANATETMKAHFLVINEFQLPGWKNIKDPVPGSAEQFISQNQAFLRHQNEYSCS